MNGQDDHIIRDPRFRGDGRWRSPMLFFVSMKARIRELIRAEPFQPFIICMANGRDYRVDHPDFVFASPNNQSWIFIEEPGTDRVHQLSGLLITSIEQASDASLAA